MCPEPVHRLLPLQLKLAADPMAAKDVNLLWPRKRCRDADSSGINGVRGVATGGISVYIPPNQSTLIFCGCSVSLEGLVNIYTHRNQIPGYASEWGVEWEVWNLIPNG